MAWISSSLEQALHRAVKVGTDRHHEYATLEHLLLALIDDADAAQVMRACNVNIEVLRSSLTKFIDEDLATLTNENSEDAKPTTGFQRVVQRAVLHVQNSGRDEVTGANVLVALFSELESHAVYLLKEQKMSRLDAVNYMSHGIAKQPGMSQTEPTGGTEENQELEADEANANDKARKVGIDGDVLTSDPAYFETLRLLIDRWCDERHFGALSRILPTYVALNGLTDGWPVLHQALKSTQALGRETFSAADWSILDGLIRDAERVLYLR